jgi:hypothetical protein
VAEASAEGGFLAIGRLALLAIGALALALLGGTVVEAPTPKIEQPAEETSQKRWSILVGLLNKLSGIKVGDVDIGELATSAVNDMYSSLLGIKDEATAQSELPGVKSVSSEFDQLTATSARLTK